MRTERAENRQTTWTRAWFGRFRRLLTRTLGQEGRPWADRITLPLFGTTVGVHAAQPVVALTFDDGPHPVGTPQILAALASSGATATFFLVADRAAEHPQLVRALLDSGHEVALHGASHSRLTELSHRQAWQLIRDGKRRLEEIAGSPVRLFRPPYGAQNPVHRLMARVASVDVIGWSAGTEDWLAAPADHTADALMGQLRPGGIVLLHDTPAGDGDRGEVVAALLERVAARGWRPTSVSGLLACGRVERRIWFPR